MSTDTLERRFSTAQAAIFLGSSRRHVENLINAGALVAWDIRLPGAKRARWSVTEASIRELLRARQRNTRTEDTRALVTASARLAREGS